MKYLLKKRSIAGFVFVLFSSQFFLNSDWQVSHQITIAADTATVWNVLVDLDSYPQWNRYSPNVKGRMAVGEVVWVEAHLDDEIRHVQNYIVSIKPQEELCWQSADWYGSLARGKRCRWLSQTDNGQTRLIHHEVMQGPLAWLIEWLYRDRIERGLKLVNESVAERALSLSHDLY
ncbi:MAG: hypothetical protein ACI9NT_002556 [Bacteroidia bacterium]|jgi:hypothetical protein